MGKILRRNFESSHPTVDFPENPFKWAGIQYYTDLQNNCTTNATTTIASTLDADIDGERCHDDDND